MTHRGNTQPNVSAVTSWPWNSAAHTLQSWETPPGPCPASCPGGPLVGSEPAQCLCPWGTQGGRPCPSPAGGSRRRPTPCSARRDAQRAGGGAGRPGCHGSQWKRKMWRKRRQRKTGRSWTDGHAPPPWSPVWRSCVWGRCSAAGGAVWPSPARGDDGGAGPWGAEGGRGRWSPGLGGSLRPPALVQPHLPTPMGEGKAFLPVSGPQRNQLMSLVQAPTLLIDTLRKKMYLL